MRGAILSRLSRVTMRMSYSVCRDVPSSRISDIARGARPITAGTALRLGLFFSMEPRYWLNQRMA